MATGTAKLTDVATGLTGSGSASFTVAVPLFGIPNPVVNSGGTSWSAITAALGPVLGERFYFTPAQNVPAAAPAPLPGVQTMIVSFRPAVASVLSGSLDSAMAALFRTVRPGDLWTAWHEGEAHVNTPADFIACLSRIYPIFKANAPASARFGEIHMSYTASQFSQYRPLSKWICCPANGGVLLDFEGTDVYPAATSDTTWATAIAPVVTEVESVLPSPVWVVAECNDSAGFTDTDAGQAAFFEAGWAWAKANGALAYVPYYGNSPCIWPPDIAVITNLAGINKQSAG